MNHTKIAFVALASCVLGLPACGGRGWQPEPSSPAQAKAARQEEESAVEAVARFKEADPSLKSFFDQARGYVVFPTVGKGGLWVGGAYGQGLVYEQGQLVGRASITQLTAGAQIGGQSYSELIFFEDEKTLRRFQRGRFELGAQVSAVAVDKGAAKNAAYDEGVAVFTLAKGGLMAEATVAGQKFRFQRTKDAGAPPMATAKADPAPAQPDSNRNQPAASGGRLGGEATAPGGSPETRGQDDGPEPEEGAGTGADSTAEQGAPWM